MAQLTVVGGGSWGTALAIVLAPRFEQVRLWVYETDLAERMQETSENDVYLPGFVLPGTVSVSSVARRIAGRRRHRPGGHALAPSARRLHPGAAVAAARK